ncbi:MAG: TMEM43 family protein [Kiritimatiellae bacterium]|nr:TMEM43 family protein [Kiritimatiellia bacterium]
MAVTETTTTSWGSRLGSSFKGMLAGLIMFIAGFPLLFWNEGNAVKTARALTEGSKSVISIDAAQLDPANEGKLIHLSGMAKTEDLLKDADFAIEQKGGIRLVRQVEMYQWQENVKTSEKKKVGGGTETVKTYTYAKTWSSAPIASEGFKESGHDNPGAFPFEGSEQYAQTVMVGAFTLTENQIKRIGKSQPFTFPEGYKVPETVKGVLQNNVIYIPAIKAKTVVTPAPAAGASLAQAVANTASNAVAQVAGAAAAYNPAAPSIGDLRVTFSVVLPHEISVVACQKGSSFVPFTASNGKVISLQSDEPRTAEQMFESAKKANAMLTWILRLVGFLVMYGGLKAILKPIETLGDVLPFLGTILGIGTSLVAGVVALVCALVTIAVAWLAYRPLVAVPLLVAAVALIIYLVGRSKARKEVAA